MVADSKGYYAILEVSERASYRESREAYRRLARKYHPDRNNSLFAEDLIRKINAAFEIISDENKRKQYDRVDYDDKEGGIDTIDRVNNDNNDNFSNTGYSQPTENYTVEQKEHRNDRDIGA